MSREQDKEGFLTPKKFAVVTPSREKKEKQESTSLKSNSFYSLSKETKYHSFPTYLSPEGKMDSNIKKEPDNPSPSRDEPSLHQVLELIVDEIDLSNTKKPHEIPLGLEHLDTFLTYIQGENNFLADCFLRLPLMEIPTAGDGNQYKICWREKIRSLVKKDSR